MHCTQNDYLVGVLLEKLDELKLSAKTLVIYIADHGEMLGDHGMQSKMVGRS
jgi:arylsulfatase A-like enzyme